MSEVDTVDRYRPFEGIDFDGQASRMIARIESHAQGANDPFRTCFFKRRNATRGVRCDDPLLHSRFVNQIRESPAMRGSGTFEIGCLDR